MVQLPTKDSPPIFELEEERESKLLELCSQWKEREREREKRAGSIWVYRERERQRERM